MSHRADKFYREDLDQEFSNRRRYPRLDTAVESAYESPNRILFNDIEDLTLRGAFLRTYVPDPTGTEAKLRMVIPGSKEVIVCKAEVVWSSKDREKATVNGMGVRFVDLDSSAMMKLADFLLDRIGERNALNFLGHAAACNA